jgi:hypothetical protein
MSSSTCKQRTHYDVIGEDGRILQAYAKVDPKTHLEQVLSDLTASWGSGCISIASSRRGRRRSR